MYISQIILRDWKAYETAVFDFPAPTQEKNLVLIGAPNGYGKTSLFEAIVLGMFGQDGLSLIASSPLSGTDEGRLNTSYKKFLEKSLHKVAKERGRTSCSVKLIFVEDNGETLEIQRIWHFNDEGIYRPQDEEVQIFEGSTRKAIGPDKYSSEDRTEWFSKYITEKLLPFTLAHFFMFDGEQVSLLAEREKSVQVRSGIEGLLGIPMLKQLADDLRKYAEHRRRETPNVSDKTIKKLEDERHQLESDYEKKTKRRDEIEPARASLKKKQTILIKELASYGAGSQALLQEQYEQIKKYEQTIERDQEKLEELMLKELALALSGTRLRQSSKERLSSEDILERWENGKNQGDQNLENFIDAVNSGIQDINPKLDDEQCASILKNVRNAWTKLWYPPPENCAKEYLHSYLNRNERLKAIEQLEELDQLSSREITELLANLSRSESDLMHLKDEVRRIENVAPEVDKKREELNEINTEIEGFDKEIGALDREIESLDGQINSKHQELARMSSKIDQAAPSTRRATQAEQVALMIKDIVSKAVPSQINAIADAMTKAHRLMVHKKDLVERIDIDEDCNVRLLDANGEDLREYDLSAGEKQIFTQALISAISSVSGRGFPMIVDTPLGRLDVEHRKGVLKHLAQKKHQVILLSTNTEVVGEYLQGIDSNVQKKYLIEFEQIGNIGQSSVRPGYFEDEIG